MRGAMRGVKRGAMRGVKRRMMRGGTLCGIAAAEWVQWAEVTGKRGAARMWRG